MTTAAHVVPFRFESHEVRTVTIDNEPWFVAKDVCKVLCLENVTKALLKVPENHKGVNPIQSPGGTQKMNVVDEPGLYRLILRSDKPQAEPFMEWVTAEVLPSIRKTGAYRQPGAASGKPESLLIVTREFRAAVRIARAAGLRDSEAVMAADKLTNELTGFSPVALLDHDVTKLPEKAL